MGERASTAVSEKAVGLVEGHALLTVTTDEERILDLSMVPIDDGRECPILALQFHDITEDALLRRLDEDELQRAGDLQRALLPAPSPDVPGWSSGAVSVPAKHVGGDFYDVRVKPQDAVVSLGDVMGKGMAAGMLAVATQTALRINAIAMSPSSALARAAGFLDDDLRRTNAFITLAYVHVDLVSRPTTGTPGLTNRWIWRTLPPTNYLPGWASPMSFAVKMKPSPPAPLTMPRRLRKGRVFADRSVVNAFATLVVRRWLRSGSALKSSAQPSPPDRGAARRQGCGVPSSAPSLVTRVIHGSRLALNNVC